MNKDEKYEKSRLASPCEKTFVVLKLAYIE